MLSQHGLRHLGTSVSPRLLPWILPACVCMTVGVVCIFPQVDSHILPQMWVWVPWGHFF